MMMPSVYSQDLPELVNPMLTLKEKEPITENTVPSSPGAEYLL